MMMITSVLFVLSLAASGGAKNLTGRFVHITDIHPDPFYTPNTKEKYGCHKTHGEKEEEGEAGYWGLEVSDCDSPTTLVDATFRWIQEHWRNEVDFVIWTGDSARHDIDNNHPRSMNEIFNLNRDIASRMREAFGKEVPIIPSIGNNDIYPHNIMFRGPSEVTMEFVNIWKHFIPGMHVHTFERGGYFWLEVISKELVVFSLNTLYFYDSNKIVDGCPPSQEGLEEIDPGTEQLEWLEVQLNILRDLGYQVYITGHVPPSPGNWFEGCYQRFGEIVLSFQDTILGNHFGHMNEDHFFWIDAHEVISDLPPIKDSSADEHDSLHPLADKSHLSLSNLVDDLKKDFKELPGKKKRDLEEYAIINVAPSIIPTYYPSMRVFTYNISRGEKDGNVFRQNTVQSTSLLLQHQDETLDIDLSNDHYDEEGEEIDEEEEPIVKTSKRKRKPKKKKKKKKGKRKHGHSHEKPKKGKKPRLPRHTSPKSPSRTNRYLSPLGYTQWYTQIDRANERDGWGPLPVGITDEEHKVLLNGTRPDPKWEVEYVTFKMGYLKDSLLDNGEKKEIPRPWPRSLDEGAFSNPYPDEDKGAQGTGEKEEFLARFAVYKLKDLTIGQWLKLAKSLGKSKKKWKGFVDRMFVGTEGDD
ncbi:hypothetical protein BT69DRAFT_1356325 [Atractiella rhizophila]|nr:hypothetical protein BT69DRAFT_1356325 [Atractiella rhizophila]